MPHEEHAYPASGAWLLDNAIRRWLQPPFELIEKLGIHQTDVVMDFGCGPGYYTIELARKTKSVMAVDLSSEMLKKAQTKAEKSAIKNIKFVQSDGKSLQVEDGTVDMIFLVTVFHEVGDKQVVLREFGRVLKAEGKLVIVEVVRKGVLPGAPIQNPQAITAEVEKGKFKLEKMVPVKRYGIFFFNKASLQV